MSEDAFIGALNPEINGVAVYHDDPAGFVRDCLRWKRGAGPAPYQVKTLEDLVEHHRVASRAGRGAGKTAENAWAILWFALTRDAAGEDWKVIVTAGVYRQLKDYLWAETVKWAKRLDWERIGRPAFTSDELMREELRLGFGSVTLAAATDPQKIEGAHADEILFIFDEAKSIPDEIFDSAEGTFSGAGDEIEQNAYVLVSSTPGAPMGRFYNIHARNPGFQRWHVRHVRLDEILKAKRMAKAWILENEERYGAESSWFANHIKGEFAAEEATGVIRMSHLEPAIERWLERDLPPAFRTQRELVIPVFPQLPCLDAIGVDLARGGKDRTVYAFRHGPVISCLLLRPSQSDAMVPAGEVKALIDSAKPSPLAIVDANGLGGPVYDRLREQGSNVQAFVAQEGVRERTRDGLYGFLNLRALAWWRLREMLEPVERDGLGDTAG